MDTTMLIAQIWGPTILAVGIGIFFSRSHYVKIYREVKNESFAALIFGMVAMSAGLVSLIFHNVWTTFPQVVISLLGWALFLKGLIFLVIPKTVDRLSDWASHSKLISARGALMIILGVYLSWISYFS